MFAFALILSISIFFSKIVSICSLTNEQWNSINSILKNKNRGFSNNIIQQQTRNIIYISYEKWAIKRSYTFKEYHYYLCRNICGRDLSIYGCIGLKNAVKNYDPYKCGIFTKYADFYLKNELYKGVKTLTPININIDEYTFNVEKNINLKKDIINVDDIDYYSDKWNNFKNILNDFEYRCAIYKYTYDFKKQMSNAKIAELMSCSEEHVRKAIVKIKNNII